MIKPKLILFSFDFHPSNQVSVLRTNHWAKNLKSKMATDINLEVVTTNSSAIKPDGVDKLIIISPHWIHLLKLLYLEDSPSVVLISAGPFSFLLPILLCFKPHKFIIDLRDPFASDPKFKLSIFKSYLKKIFQSLFLRSADAIITLNSSLAKDYGVPKKKKTLLISNGLEDNIHKPELSAMTNNKVVIMGKVYEDVSFLLEELVKHDPALQIDQYVNQDQVSRDNIVQANSFTRIVSPIPKKDVMSMLSNYNIGIVSSYPKDYVLPVKVFDYIAANLKIIVCSDNNGESEMKTLLKSYPNTLYVKDISQIRPAEIAFFLKKTIIPFDISNIPKKYFRSYSTEMLASFLDTFF